MRVCVLALAAIAFSQPALAKDRSHKAGITKHQAHGHHRVAKQRKAIRLARQREAPIESGYAMPQSWDEVTSPPARRRAPQQSAWQQPAQPQWSAPAPTFSPRAAHGELDAAIARHATANGLPVDLVHRVVKRESNYNPRASSKGNIGLMQIRHATARGVGYTGSAAGLLDAETNLTYAVRYLAGAYHAAGGNPNRAVAYYASGYHGRGVARASRVADARRARTR